MPFTAAHPAIVLPFIRLNPKYVSATGLIIGSVSPDFEYFLKMSVDSKYSHTIPGIFYFDIPITIGLAFLFHLVIKRNLILNLPPGIQQRFQDLLRSDFRQYFREHFIAFMVCSAFGAATHVFWDSFTHNGAYFARELSFIRGSFVSFLGTRYPMFFVLQQVSTGVGLSIIVLYIIYMKPDPIRPYKPSFNYWMWCVIILLITVAVRFLMRNYDFNLGNLVVTMISGFCVALVVTGFIKYEYNY